MNPKALNLIVRVGIRTVAVDFDDYQGGAVIGRHRSTLHRTLDDALDAINAEVARSSKPEPAVTDALDR